MSGTLSSNTFRMAVAAFERAGHRADPILENCKISRNTVENLWSRIPIEKERAFWKLASQEADDPQIGLSLGLLVPFGTFPLLEYVGASCPSILHALHLLTRYSKIVYGGWNPELDERDNRVELRLGAEGDADDSRPTTEFTFSLLWKRLQEFSSVDFPLTAVHFRHRPKGPLETYTKIFGPSVSFEASEDVLVFPPHLGAIACKNSNPLALGSLIHGVDALLSKLTKDSSLSGSSHAPGFIESIRAEIEIQVSSGDISADKIATRLGISKRTLQRKLETAGRSLRALVSEVRRDFATNLLKNSDESVEQIALRVGYSDLKAFTRAFSEWYRMSPTAFRRSQRK